jgi:hypothetical protein
MLGPLLLGLGACEEKTKATCASPTVLSTSPVDGAVEVRTDAALEITLSGPAPTLKARVDGGATPGWVSLTAPDGAEGEASVAVLRFDAPLQPNAVYTVELEACGDPLPGFSFETRPPAVDAGRVGEVWHLDLLDPAILWTEPPQAFPLSLLAGGLATTRGLLLKVEALEADRLDLLGGLSEELDGALIQHRCTSPVLFEGADLSDDPRFTAAPRDLELSNDGEPVLLYDTELGGLFDGEALRELRLSGRFDLRQVNGAEDIDACVVLNEVFGGRCTPCPDQGPDEPPWCAVLDVTWPEAQRAEGLRFERGFQPAPECFE